MTQIEVLQDGQQKVGELRGRDQAVDPETGQQAERLTVQWDNGASEYVWPGREAVREIGAPPPPPSVPGLPPGALDHLTPPPGQAPLAHPPMTEQAPVPEPTQAAGGGPGTPGWRPSAPQSGVVMGGQVMPAVPPPVAYGAPEAPSTPLVLPSAPVAPVPVEKRRFMVQPKSGKARTYHSHDDCSQVTNGAPQLDLNDEQIEFFDLRQCAACKRQDEKLGWQELVTDFLTDEDVAEPAAATARLQALFEGHGFKVTPPAVDRDK